MTTRTVLVNRILEDAAARTGVSKEQLEVLSAEAVTWSDGSLGCPAPGMNYTQALVAGYRVRVCAGPGVLDYHADSKGRFFLCPPDRAVEPAATPER